MGPRVPSMVKSVSPLLLNALEGLPVLEAYLKDLGHVAMVCYNAHLDLNEVFQCIIFP